MAQPPKKAQLTKEDIGDAPSWFDKVLLVLNPFLASVANALNGNLTRAENMQSEIKEVTLSVPSSVDAAFPLRFKTNLHPYAVVLAQCLPLGSGAVSGGVAIHTWKLTQDGQVEISYISGLNPSTKYRLTFLVE